MGGSRAAPSMAGRTAWRPFAPSLGGAARLLAIDGVALFEVGDGQAPAVAGTMRAAGLARIVEHRDLSGPIRCLSAGLNDLPQLM